MKIEKILLFYCNKEVRAVQELVTVINQLVDAYSELSDRLDKIEGK